MLIFGLVLWYLVGVAGFIYWWTRELDFTMEEVHLAILTGFLGPLTWVLGLGIHDGS